MNKSNDLKNKPLLLVILGCIVAFGGLVFIPILFSSFSVPVLIFGLILILGGVVIIVYGSLKLKTFNKIKELLKDETAYITEATYIKATVASTNSMVLFSPSAAERYRKVVYKYTDESGVNHTATSYITYNDKQVDYLKNKGVFKIKCKGELSVIIEEF